MYCCFLKPDVPESIKLLIAIRKNQTGLCVSSAPSLCLPLVLDKRIILNGLGDYLAAFRQVFGGGTSGAAACRALSQAEAASLILGERGRESNGDEMEVEPQFKSESVPTRCYK